VIVGRWEGSNAYAFALNYAGSPSASFFLAGVGGRLDATVTTGGAWHLFTATYDGVQQEIFEDGIVVASQAGSGSFNDNGDNLLIGSEDDGLGSVYMNGSMDDVRIYNRALSGGEVQQLFLMGH
jgi:hypothetical protein